MDTPHGGDCAVVREDGPIYDIPVAAEVMAKVLGGVTPDWSRLLRDRPGILAEDLPLESAHVLAASLSSQHIPAFVMPQDQMAVPPPPLLATQAQPSENGLMCRSARQAEFIPWDEVILLECAHVRAASRNLLNRPPQERPGSPPGPIRAHEPAGRDLLDIICYEPWLHLRVDAETFAFASMGLPLQTARRLNFINLARLVRGRCPDAEAGPGALQTLGRRANATLNLPSLEACDNHLLWRLQLLWREKD